MAFQQSYFSLKLLRYFFIAIIPICFLISPYLVLLPILGICIIYKFIFKTNKESSFMIIFLFTTLFSGIAFIGLRLYDWAIIFAFIELLLSGEKIKIRLEIPAFFSIVLLIFLYNYHDYSIISIARYAFSLMLLTIILNKKSLFPVDKRIFNEIFISIIYFSIAIFLFTKIGIINNITSSILSTNVYVFKDEVRMNGFFSDPNKYMSYVFILIFLVKKYWEKGQQHFSILCLTFAAILSMSRTAIFVLILFFIGTKIMQTKKYQTILKISATAFFVISLLMIIAFPDLIGQWGNDFFLWSAEVLGREHTLMQNQSLSEDNRIIIWTSAMYYIAQSPLLGHGWLSFKEFLPYPTHNTALSLLLEGGVVALGNYIFLFRDLLFNKYWPIVLPLIIIPLVTLDLTDYRMEFLLLGVIWNEKSSMNVRKDKEYINS